MNPSLNRDDPIMRDTDKSQNEELRQFLLGHVRQLTHDIEARKTRFVANAAEKAGLDHWENHDQTLLRSIEQTLNALS